MFSIITSPVKTIKSFIISLVASRAKSLITPSLICSKLTVILNNTVAKAIQGIDDEAMRKYCAIVSDSSKLCGVISKAIEDKEVTNDETSEIISSVEAIVGKAITKEVIDRTIDGIAERLKGEL